MDATGGGTAVRDDPGTGGLRANRSRGDLRGPLRPRLVDWRQGVADDRAPAAPAGWRGRPGRRRVHPAVGTPDHDVLARREPGGTLAKRTWQHSRASRRRSPRSPFRSAHSRCGSRSFPAPIPTRSAAGPFTPPTCDRRWTASARSSTGPRSATAPPSTGGRSIRPGCFSTGRQQPVTGLSGVAPFLFGTAILGGLGVVQLLKSGPRLLGLHPAGWCRGHPARCLDVWRAPRD